MCDFVPVHKDTLNNWEYVGFARLCKILGNKYDIFLVTYSELNITVYQLIANRYHVVLNRLDYHNKIYFNSGIFGYQLMMMDFSIYYHFKQLGYKYIFIYQTDCYILYDNLEYWINKDYDQMECIMDFFEQNFYNGIGLRKLDTFLIF